MRLIRAIHPKGERIYVDTGSVLTSNPPQYNFYWDEFGKAHGGYIRCSELDTSETKIIENLEQRVRELENMVEDLRELSYRNEE